MKKQQLLSAVLCAVLLFWFFSRAVSASGMSPDSLQWVRTGGPPGGLGYDIRYNFDNLDIWYVTDNWAGVHKSTDNGMTWQPANTGIPPQAGPTGDAIPIFSLTVDPHDPQTLWVGTNPTGRIYRSTNGGESWERRDNGVTIDYDGGLTFRGFTVDPTSSDIVYAMGETSDPLIGGAIWGPGTGGTIFKTVDGGANWEKVWDGGMPSSLARYMFIDPRNTDVLYVSTGIFDRGAVGETNDPENDPDPFGGLGILKSTDGGQTWDILNVDNGLNHLYIGSLFMHPDDPDLLLAAAGHLTPAAAGDYMKQNGYSPLGIYRTTDGGDSWDHVLEPDIENPGECITAVEIHPVQKHIAFAGSAMAIHVSYDTGLTWTQVSTGIRTWGPPGITAGWPIDLQCDPRDTLRLFANNYNGGNFMSEDGGRTWQNASLGYTGCQTRSVSVDPFDASRVFEAGRSGLWRTRNGGGTWEGIFYPPDDEDWIPGLEWHTIKCDPHESNHALAAHSLIMETTDGGQSWELRWNITNIINDLPEDIPDQSIAGFEFAPSEPDIVYANLCSEGLIMGHERGDFQATRPGGGLIRSSDGGITWERAVDETLGDRSVLDIAVDPVDSKIVYAATPDGLFKTTNGGDSWGLMSNPPDTLLIRTVAVDPDNPQHILAGLEGVGIYVSSDGGQSWEAGYTGLEANGSLHDIVFDPVDPEVAYVSDFYSGVYRSEDGGRTWVSINKGLRTRSTLTLSISSNGKHLYAATEGEGVFRLDLYGPLPTEESESPDLPFTFHLDQNFPNPFNPETTIYYSLETNSDIRLEILNLRGQAVRTLVDENQNAGSYVVLWDGDDGKGVAMPSGIYFYKLTFSGQSETRKMLLLR